MRVCKVRNNSLDLYFVQRLEKSHPEIMLDHQLFDELYEVVAPGYYRDEAYLKR